MNWRFHSVHSLFFVSAKIIENTFEVCTKFKQSKIKQKGSFGYHNHTGHACQISKWAT